MSNLSIDEEVNELCRRIYDSEADPALRLEMVKYAEAYVSQGARPKKGHAHWFVLSCLAALLSLKILWLDLIRYCRRSTACKPGPKAAIHGEQSNRTRHIVNNLPGDVSGIVILGRPRTGLNKLETQLGLSGVIYPMDVATAFKVLFASILACWRYGRALAKAPFPIPLRDQVAMTYRLHLGRVQARWWESYGSANVVLFGHTGLGDSATLEAAMQDQGARTIHVLHGASHGWNFVASSTKALCQSGFDAKLTASLPDYQESMHIPMRRPKPKRGSKGILLFTAYSHPMNPSYQSEGIAADLRIMRLVADVAHSQTLSTKLCWKPHPAFHDLPQIDKDLLTKAAKDFGYTMRSEQITAEDMTAFATVLTTPSSVLVDALRAGQLPVLVTKEDDPLRGMYAEYPLRASSFATVKHLVQHIETNQAFVDSFQETWSLIEPGKPISKDILNEVLIREAQ